LIMSGQLSHELEVSVGAGEVWEVYRGLQLGKLAWELLPDVIESVTLLEGDGGVGTILKAVFSDGKRSYNEKFTKIDDENRVKEAEIVEGGYLDIGFSLYRVRFEILENKAAATAKSSIIKSTIEYEIAPEYAANASLVSTKLYELIAQAIGNYLSK
ncbi:pathogenesis-related BetVI family protein, partial [Ralstonia pseudosolanacearum]|uniref:pathogenesis-related BetVI family protein n=1 Tax=Ralstonia pseudosolanacearum TaxID=1310165 RepID=UPI003CE6A4DA